MEKDIIVRAIRFLMHVWQEAKKPVLRARMAGKFTVLPSRDSGEKGKPVALFRGSKDVTLIYLLLALVFMPCALRTLIKIFY